MNRSCKRATFWSGAALLTIALVANLEAADVSAGRALNEQLGCTVCHGKDGMGVREDTPNLAGQDWSYLIRQLEAFADTQAQPTEGDTERYHAGMEATTRNLTYDEMKSLADYYASLSCIPAADSDVTAAPEAVRSCVRCHGPLGINIEPGIPILAGQNAGYLARQLRAFRSSRLGTDPLRAGEERHQQIMSENAVSLSDQDIDRIAGYFAGLTCR